MIKRVNINVMGAVQGVGFRPFVYRLASLNDIKGFVINNSHGVFIDAEAEEEVLADFIKKVYSEKPVLSQISYFHYSFHDSVGYDDFKIKHSFSDAEPDVFILPDFSVCDDCLHELFDPHDRRYLYPFINCTNCGPRFTIINSLPYDRINTVMNKFELCPDCLAEYTNPLNRRYHAQPVACTVCGPQLFFMDINGNRIAEKNEALELFCDKILSGEILALKGIGGFQLVTRADNNESVKKLRLGKKRTEKPFALMFTDIEAVKQFCKVDPQEDTLLKSPQAPIVILSKKDKNSFAQVAPSNPNLGIMLPYSPLHHLIMRKLKLPLVVTSGNLSEEPICIDNDEALTRLNGIADGFLANDRDILRHADDSIIRVISGKPVILRRARGYAPLPVFSGIKFENTLAGGGHLKNNVSFSKGKNIFISQHIGDLENLETLNAFKKVIDDITGIYKYEPEFYVNDFNPEYMSSKYFDTLSTNINLVQHHVAHIYSCRAENQINGKALGVAWDGVGLGTDRTLWGGEFFISDEQTCRRIASLREFLLPGAETAIREPRRSALGILYKIFGDNLSNKMDEFIEKNFPESQKSVLIKMLDNKVNCISTSSAGRLFDAVSSLLNLCSINEYEGQGAMMLEFAAETDVNEFYNFDLDNDDIMRINWEPIINEILEDLNKNLSVQVISAKFHNSLSQIILSIAKIAGEKNVVLSGGCFQNKYLTENTIKLLEENDFRVYFHQSVPPNDGGISFGQIAASRVKLIT